MTESSKKTAVPKARTARRGKTLTTSEKAEAIALWRAGDTTLDQLAEKFSRDRNTFIRLFNKEGVTKGEARVEHEKKVAEAVESAALGDVAVQAARIRETKERSYKNISTLQALGNHIVVKCIQEKRPLASEAANLKAVREAMQIQAIGRSECFAILGLDKEDKNDDSPLPELVIQELTSDEIKQMHRQMQEGDELKGLLSDLDTTPGEGE